MCEHLRNQATVDVDHVQMADGTLRYMARVQVRCLVCGTRYAFQGLPMGMSLTEPMIDPVGFELRAPIVPDPHGTSMLASDAETRFPWNREQPPDLESHSEGSV